jgi:hypothetical protein
MARRFIELDRDKLRAAIRKLGNEYVFYLLDDAIDLLPPAKLHRLVKQYLDVKPLRPDPVKLAKASLLEEVKAFAKASVAGECYQAFDVNSENCTEQSSGTSAWIAACRRLFDRCVTEATKTDPVEVRQAMDTLFGLLDHIDEGRDDVVFFADGHRQGVDAQGELRLFLELPLRDLGRHLPGGLV